MPPQTRRASKRNFDKTEVIEIHDTDSEQDQNPKRQKISIGAFKLSYAQGYGMAQ